MAARPARFGAAIKRKNDPEAVRVAQVRQLFMAGSYSRTGNGVFVFFGWLDTNRPELLPSRKHGDPYQSLKSDLSGLYKG
jgi:hypothetical protein